MNLVAGGEKFANRAPCLGSVSIDERAPDEVPESGFATSAVLVDVVVEYRGAIHDVVLLQTFDGTPT